MSILQHSSCSEDGNPEGWKIKGSAFSSEIDREIDLDEEEKGVIKKQTKKLTEFEIRTADEMVESLAEIKKICGNPPE